MAALLEEKVRLTRSPWRVEVRKDLRERFTRRGYLLTEPDAETFRRLLNERYDADYRKQLFNRKRAATALALAEGLCSRLEEVIRDG